MSPEIRIDGQLVANVPDTTGSYQALDGSSLRVDSNGIEARNDQQVLILEGLVVGGLRIVGLTQEGKGCSSDRKRGDGKQPSLEVLLHDRPIRVSYTRYEERDRYSFVPPHTYRDWSKRTYYNPRWMRR